MRPFAGLAPLFLFGIALFAQAPPTNASLTGKYFVRHVMFTTDASNNVVTAGSIFGTMTFNGGGNYSFTGQRVAGTGSAASFTVSGTYSMTSAAIVTLTNPQNSALTVNARFGAEAVIGSSTEAGPNTLDMLVAIPQPTAAQTNATIGASFHVADFELTNASTAQVRDAAIAMTLDGAGNIFRLIPHRSAASRSLLTRSRRPSTSWVRGRSIALCLMASRAPLPR